MTYTHLTTELIGIKDKNIKILFVLKHQTHLEIRAKLDYDSPRCPHCQGKVYQVRFSKVVKNPYFRLSGVSNLPPA